MVYALRMALRQFRLQPAFAAIVVLVLGLGTGAATAVYTIVDSVVLRPLPYPRSGSAGEALGHQHREGPRTRPVLAGHVHGLQGAAGVRGRGGVVAARRQPARSRARAGAGQDDRDERQPRSRCSASDRSSARGSRRTARSSRETPIAVISDRLWRTRYGADPGVDRPAARPQRHGLHDRRRHAGGVPLPRRRRRLAAAAVGSRAAQPQRAFHGRRGPAEGRRRDRAGAGRRGHAGGPARPAVRRQQQGLGDRASCRC